VPRRLSDLGDDVITLVPLARSLAPRMRWVVEPDDGIADFTFIPTNPQDGFLEQWLGRYEDDRETRKGFAIDHGDDLVGFAAYVRLDAEQRQGEIGYVVAPAARGRGLAARAVGVLTHWGFADLGLERIELRIDARNAASEKVARRCGYTHEGTLRNLAFKEGRRSDVAVWSRLRTD
jgi:RimJ/RimL family protein N-acetyltransferase